MKEFAGDLRVEGKGVWTFRKISAAQIELNREHHFEAQTRTLDTAGSFWIFGIAEIRKGSIQYVSKDGRSLKGKGHYGLFFPPGSLVHSVIHAGTHQAIRLWISSKRLAGTPEDALIFEVDPQEAPESIGMIGPYLRSVKKRTTVEYNPAPTGIGKRVKGLLDRSYKESISMETIAKSLRTNSTTVGRVFKRDFGITPVRYRNHLRVTLSGFELLMGAPVTGVFQSVGFEDLSRFNKQFKRLTGVSPKKFKPRKSKNAKS